VSGGTIRSLHIRHGERGRLFRYAHVRAFILRSSINLTSGKVRLWSHMVLNLFCSIWNSLVADAVP